jgi:5'-3' exonuclease
MLVGDPVDNIKGVPGIGPVKANRLLDSVVPEEWHQAVMNLYSCEEEI